MRCLVDYAKTFIGLPYIWGGSNPVQGFDCSGFVQFILDSVGCDPIDDQTAQGLHDALLQSGGRTTPVAAAGVLCFYGEDKTKITHVALCINEFQIIEAGGGGRHNTNVEAAALNGACVRIKPYNRRKDLVAFIKPNYPTWVLNGNS